MRRLLALWLVLVLTLLVVGCGPKAAEESGDTAEPKPVRLAPVSVATGPAGGVLQLQGGVIADAANALVEGAPFGITAGGSVTNVTVVGKKEAGIGITVANFLDMGIKGEGSYEEDKGYPDLRALFSTTAPVYSIAIAPGVKAKSFEELVRTREKIRVGGATPASPSYWITEAILEYYGSSLADMRAWGCEIMLQSVSENLSTWNDGRADLIYTIQAVPSDMLVQAFAARRGVVWDLPEAVRDALVKKGFVKVDIPAGTYTGIDKTLKSVGSKYVWFGNADLSEEAAYYFTKAAAESQERLAAAVSHEFMTDWSPERMLEGITIPFHEGAKRYFRERGWQIPGE